MAAGVSSYYAINSTNSHIDGKVYYSETYDVAQNTSNVTIRLKLYRNNDYSGNTTPGKVSTFYLYCNGKKQSVTIAAEGVTIPPKANGSIVEQEICSYTFTGIAHNSDGSKSISIGVEGSLVNCGSAGTISVSRQDKTITLTKIPRRSTLSASNGTLGISQSLTVTRQDTGFTHTITYTCGSASGTICTKSTSNTISFTPPLSLASQNTTGTSVSIVFTITTYSGSTSLGSSTKTISCSIPSSVKPSVSMSVTTTTDTTNTNATFSSPIKGKSKLNISLNVTISGNSPIKSYSITANGESFTTSTCTTSYLKDSGNNTITATVTDARGRTATATQTINVLDYTAPRITALTVKRCNSNGIENDQGSFIKITFSGNINSLNNQNNKSWKIHYGTSSNNLNTYSLTSTENQYSISSFEKIISADTGSSYIIKVEAKDSFEDVLRSTTASTAFTIMHFKSNGRGMAVGKVAELDNVFDIGFKARFYNGIQPMILQNENGVDLNDIKTTGIYVSVVVNVSYSNCPIEQGVSFLLEVLPGGSGTQLLQRITKTDKNNCIVYQRFLYTDAGTSSNTWGEWTKIYQQNPVELWSGEETLGRSSDNLDYIYLSESISSQIHGIILRFKLNQDLYHYQDFCILKDSDLINNKYCTFNMVSYTFKTAAMKILRFSDVTVDGVKIGKILGDSNNETTGTGTSGIKYDNSKMLLVKVFGW